MWCWVVSQSFIKDFAVFDLSPLTSCINCYFCIYICNYITRFEYVVIIQFQKIRIGVEIWVIWQRLEWLCHFFSVCVPRSGYLWTSCENSDINVKFSDPSLLKEMNVLSIKIHFLCLLTIYLLSMHRHGSISTSSPEFDVTLISCKPFWFWYLSNISGNVWPYFYCAFAKTAICELLVKI